MHVTSKMIDSQLRLTGKVMDMTYGVYLKNVLKPPNKPRKKSRNPPKPGKNCKGVTNSELWIPRIKNDSKLRIRVYKPLKPKQGVPGVLWLHGGGYAIGAPETSHPTIRRLIEESECVVVSPDYCLSVERPYPAALEDAYAALLWLNGHADELGVRNDQLMVGGESAGGGLTAALTLYARDMGEVSIAFQMPLYPMIDDRMITESAKENNAPVWNSDLNRAAWKLYLGDLFEKEVPAYAAPARADDFSNLSPTCTFVGEFETFRDETIQYVEDLRKAGIHVDFELYKGCYHAFDVMCAKSDVSRRATEFLLNSFRYAVKNYFAEQPVLS